MKRVFFSPIGNNNSLGQPHQLAISSSLRSTTSRAKFLQTTFPSQSQKILHNDKPLTIWAGGPRGQPFSAYPMTLHCGQGRFLRWSCTGTCWTGSGPVFCARRTHPPPAGTDWSGTLAWTSLGHSRQHTGTLNGSVADLPWTTQLRRSHSRARLELLRKDPCHLDGGRSYTWPCSKFYIILGQI